MKSERIDQKVAFFAVACRKAGLKVTQQRLEIYRELAAAVDHPSAEMLYGRLAARMPTLSLDTVYRTLAMLHDHGLVKKVETAESQARFEVVFTRHHHVICRHCHEIADFLWEQLDEAPLPKVLAAWGRIDSRSIVVYGVCRKCGKEGDTD